MKKKKTLQNKFKNWSHVKKPGNYMKKVQKLIEGHKISEQMKKYYVFFDGKT